MKQHKKRLLKIYYGYGSHSYRRHPVIHLAGKYLEEMNFHIGDKIEVLVGRNYIKIHKAANQKE